MFLVVAIMVLAVSVCFLRVIFACCVFFFGVLEEFENIFGTVTLHPGKLTILVS